jgi:hypothetical protein
MWLLARFLLEAGSPGEPELLVPVLEGALDRCLPGVTVAMRSVLAATVPGVVQGPEETLVLQAALLVPVCGALRNLGPAALELAVACRLGDGIPLDDVVETPFAQCCFVN